MRKKHRLQSRLESTQPRSAALSHTLPVKPALHCLTRGAVPVTIPGYTETPLYWNHGRGSAMRYTLAIAGNVRCYEISVTQSTALSRRMKVKVCLHPARQLRAIVLVLFGEAVGEAGE